MDAYKFDSLEDYVKNESRNYYRLSHRGIENWYIRQFCNSKGVKVTSRETRGEMLDKLFETDDYVIEFYESFREYICVNFIDYAERFGLTRSEYNKLKKANFFEIECFFEAKSQYGWITVPALSAEQFFNMTREDIDMALNNNQKPLF